MKRVDISDVPDLLKIAEEVRASNEPRLLQRADEDLAVLTPVPRRPRRVGPCPKTDADMAAFRSSFGSWKDLVDVDELERNIQESRGQAPRPPVDL